MMPFLNRQLEANPDNELRRLIKQSGDKSIAKRSSAKQAIYVDLIEHPQHLDMILSALQKELHRAQWMVCVVWITLVFVTLNHLHDIYKGKWIEVMPLIVHACIGCFALQYPFARTCRLKSLLEVVANIDDLRLVGTLLQAQQYLDVKSATREALERLLPRMQHSDAPLLDEQQRTILYQSLNDKNVAWVRTVLKALEQIGDDKAIPYVEKLVTASRTEPEIGKAARECLLYLKQRLEQQQISQSLLRASAASSSPDILLRAATISDTTEPKQLLRAVNSMTSDDR